MYQNTCFKALDRLDKPFIYSYSAYIDKNVIQKSKAHGFDGVEGQLNHQTLQEILRKDIFTSVNHVINSHFQNLF